MRNSCCLRRPLAQNGVMANRSGAAEAEAVPGGRPPAVDSRSWIERLWSSIAERGRASVAVPGVAVAVDRACLLAEALLSERGEASGAAVAQELQAVLGELGEDELAAFLRFLAGGFLPDPERLQAQARAYLAEPSAAAAAALAQAAEPPRQELLRRMNLAPGGTGTLVALRRAMLGLLRREPPLKPLDDDFRHLFASWFNRGFLELRRIDWQTPAAALEKLITYEAVHEITGWDDLRRRLAPDRRCFGFFHPALPGEPLIFVEVALVQGLATAVQPLLTPEGDDAAARAKAADTAIFYSISNCQEGLRGISFGNFLIKQVVEELRAECPGLTRFATLSPVPGFRRWLEGRLAALADPDRRRELSETDRAELLRPLAKVDGKAESSLAALLAEAPPATDPSAERQWWCHSQHQQLLRPAMLRLCACYLTQQAADPVARFHLGNGARLEHINWMGNSAARGFAESYGIMVNYLYDPATIETNHEAFVRDGTVARAVAVDALRGVPSMAPSRRAAARPDRTKASSTRI